MCLADVVLVTSLREGLPGVVLEACALGTPVVASDLSGVQWLAEGGLRISQCSLGSPNSVWVQEILRAAAESPSHLQREAALKEVELGEFRNAVSNSTVLPALGARG